MVLHRDGKMLIGFCQWSLTEKKKLHAYSRRNGLARLHAYFMYEGTIVFSLMFFCQYTTKFIKEDFLYPSQS